MNSVCITHTFISSSPLSPPSLSPVTPEALAQLLNLLESGFISSSAAKVVFQEMWKTPEKCVEQLVRELDLALISDREELLKICQRVMGAHPELVRLT
ncbi:glutamyl-tRNA(Gln) amidotransferase subunit B, mitochondrial isoform X1 [Tachysurus ichikawai]